MVPARMAERIVEVEHLRKEFKGTVAVADVSFAVTRGEIVGLLGANGAGKTTTIQILLGLTTVTAGTVRIFGMDLGGTARRSSSAAISPRPTPRCPRI